MLNIDTYGIRERFKGHDYITKDDLNRYFAEQEPSLKDSTLRWRIHQLKANNQLVPVKSGVYSLNNLEKKPAFTPPSSRMLEILYSIYLKRYNEVPCSLWSTEWLIQFMEMQPTHSFFVFEIDKELTHSLFFHLKEENKDAYLNPDHEMVRDYLWDKKNQVVVKPLISRSPLQKTKNGIPIASLEKILVDIFCDKDLYIAYQGSELTKIFRNAWDKYSLNPSVLMNYAKRRKRSKALLEFLKKYCEELYILVSK